MGYFNTSLAVAKYVIKICVKCYAKFQHEYLELASVESTVKEKEAMGYMVIEVSWFDFIHGNTGER